MEEYIVVSIFFCFTVLPASVYLLIAYVRKTRKFTCTEGLITDRETFTRRSKSSDGSTSTSTYYYYTATYTDLYAIERTASTEKGTDKYKVGDTIELWYDAHYPHIIRICKGHHFYLAPVPLFIIALGLVLFLLHHVITH